ncbi:unnamed protein product [Urochloa humidicola]
MRKLYSSRRRTPPSPVCDAYEPSPSGDSSSLWIYTEARRLLDSLRWHAIRRAEELFWPMMTRGRRRRQLPQALLVPGERRILRAGHHHCTCARPSAATLPSMSARAGGARLDSGTNGGKSDDLSPRRIPPGHWRCSRALTRAAHPFPLRIEAACGASSATARRHVEVEQGPRRPLPLLPVARSLLLLELRGGGCCHCRGWRIWGFWASLATTVAAEVKGHSYQRMERTSAAANQMSSILTEAKHRCPL